MKLFLKKVFKFISIPLIIIVVCETCIIIFKNDIFSDKKFEKVFDKPIHLNKWVDVLPKKNKILIGGNSTVRYGINPKLLNQLAHDTISFVNIGFDARDPIESYFILKNLNLTNVSKFYYAIDPINYIRVFYKNRYHYYYLDFTFLECIKYFTHHDNKVFFDRYIGLYDYFLSSYINEIKDNINVPLDLGAKISMENPKEFNPVVREIFEVEEYGWSDLEFNYLKKIVNLCKRNKIEFHPIIMPRRSDFSSKYNKYCKDIQKQFKEKLSVILYDNKTIGEINCLDNLGDEKIFINCHHLNAKGQLIFTKLFYKLITKNIDGYSKN